MVVRFFMAIFICLCCTGTAFSDNSGSDGGDGGTCTNGTNCAGGDGTAGGTSGEPGLPGCVGGTKPAADGKFYVPDTDQECNPSKEEK